MNNLPKTAVLGADSPIGLTVLRELGEQGVPLLAVGRKPNSLGRYSRYASEYQTIAEGDIEHWLPGLVEKHDIRAVMAFSENELIALAQMKGTIPNCAILVPDSDKLAVILDKQKTLDIAAAAGIDVPYSWQPQNTDNIEQIARSLSYPVAIKWNDPPAIAGLLEEHDIRLEKVEYAGDHDALLSILSRYDGLNDWPLVQTWCPGYGFGQMLNMNNGKATLTFQHQRLREWPPSGGVSTFCEMVPLAKHQQQMQQSEKLLQAIGWQGPAMVEYRHDPATGKYWLMEINGRFWGSIPLAYHSGAHFAWELYRNQILGQTEPAPRAFRQRKARYAIPDAKHFREVAVKNCKNLSWAQNAAFITLFFADFFNPAVRYYVWQWKDPKPFFSDCWNGIKTLLPGGSGR